MVRFAAMRAPDAIRNESEAFSMEETLSGTQARMPVVRSVTRTARESARRRCLLLESVCHPIPATRSRWGFPASDKLSPLLRPAGWDDPSEWHQFPRMD